MRYIFHDFELDTQVFELRNAGMLLRLEPKAFNVLLYLIEHRERVISKDELLQHLWPDQAVTDWALTYCLNHLRKAIADGGRKNLIIKTVYGRGYRFVAPVLLRETDETDEDHASRVPWNIPAGNPFFTGRDDALDLMRDACLNGHVGGVIRPQAIVGLGGIGKTQVAIHYAHAHRDAYQAGLWVNADSEQSMTTSFIALANVLNLPEKNEERHDLVIEAVKRWLRTHGDWLLIFDNADDPARIVSFLPESDMGQVLLTSRAPFVDTLGISVPIHLDVLRPDDALLFLTHRVGRTEMDDDERQAGRDLAIELDGLPLALEQAGAYILANHTRFQDYLAGYRTHHIALLDKRHPKTGTYSKTVATTWMMNFHEVERVSPASADVLRLCAFLSPDAIPICIIPSMGDGVSDALSDALASVTDDPLIAAEILEPLTRFSLIRITPQSQTFDIHRLVQAVVREAMDVDEKQRWKTYAITVLSRVFPHSVEFWTWFRCEQLLEHVRVCDAYIISDGIQSRDAAHLLSLAGEYLRERARFSDAEPFLVRALALWESEVGPAHPEVSMSLSKLAVLFRAQGRYVEAEPLYLRAITILEDLLGADHPNVAIRVSNLAVLYQMQGRYADAEPLFLRAMAIREAALGPGHPDMAISVNKLGVLYRDQGRYDEAEPLFIHALQVREAVLGMDHPDVTVTLNHLALLYRAQGRYSEARHMVERSLELRERVLGLDHPDVASCLNNLAFIYKAQGQYADAESLLQRALAIRETALGPDHPDVALSLTNLAVLFGAEGRYAEAKPLCKRALAIREHVLGAHHPDVASSLNNLAVLMQAHGDDAAAESHFRRALMIQETVVGPEHPRIIEVLQNLAGLLRKTTRILEAEQIEQRVDVLCEGFPHRDVTHSVSE